jgi:cytochrome c
MSRPFTAISLTMIALLAACSKAPSDGQASTAPAANAVDTLSGAKFSDFRGNAAAGEAAFVQCKACHVIDPGINLMGPSLHAVVGRKAGSIDSFHYSPAIRNSGITWSEAKLFEFLESPRRVVPGTAMSYGGMSNPQKRADVIAYLKANGS